jgi:hypothetical protein
MSPVGSAAGRPSRYGVHPSVYRVQKWARDLGEQTGRSLDQWLTLIAKKAPSDRNACRAWLVQTHGLGANSASWLADMASGTADCHGDPDRYLRTAER